MKIETKTILIVSASCLVILMLAGYVYWRENEFSTSVSSQLPQISDDITTESYLDGLANWIRFYDERLTQAARNYAFTGDTKWKQRYNEDAPKLNDIIKQAIDKGNNQDKKNFENIDKSNLALVDLETQSMKLVDEGHKDQAVTILQSDQYWQLKAVYQKGLEDYIARRGQSYDSVLSVSAQKFDNITKTAQQMHSTNMHLLLTFLLVLLVIFAVIILFLRITFLKPIELIDRTAQAIADGDFSQKLENEKNDEIGQLSRSINKMSDAIKKTQKEIEEKVQEKTKGLEQVNRAMMGRELKMIELKEIISELKKKGR